MGLADIMNRIPGLTVQAGGGRSLNYAMIAGTAVPLLTGTLAYLNGLDFMDSYQTVKTYDPQLAHQAAAMVGFMAGLPVSLLAQLGLIPRTVNNAIEDGVRIRNNEEKQTDEEEKEQGKYKGGSIKDVLNQAGVPEEVIEAQDQKLWDNLETISRPSVESRNEVFFLNYTDLGEFVLKAYDKQDPMAEQKARFAAAAYHELPEHFGFTVPTQSPEPLLTNGTYLVLQQRKMGAKVTMPLSYWLRTLAEFHKEGKARLESVGIAIPEADFPTIDSLAETHQKLKSIIPIDYSRLRDGRDFLVENPYRVLCHRDIKPDNLEGPALLDPDNAALDHSIVDIAPLVVHYSCGNVNKAAQYYAACFGDPIVARMITEAMPSGGYYMVTRMILGDLKRGALTQKKIERNQELAYRRDVLARCAQ